MRVTWNLLEGDVRAQLATLPDESVHCVMTSPPYWGLRDYGLPPTVWDGDPGCPHDWEAEPRLSGRQSDSGTDDGYTGRQRGESQGRSAGRGDSCARCGAWRGQFGLEPTPDLYIAHLVEVFREVRRVLRSDGTCWLNLGDTYAAARAGHTHTPHTGTVPASARGEAAYGEFCKAKGGGPRDALSIGLKHKDLVGIPWMAAFALRDDGWWLRSDIVWAKRNCLPESVQDRPTRSHEFIFLLSKSERYFYDAFAIREAEAMRPQRRLTSREENPDAKFHGQPAHRRPEGGTGGGTRNKRDVWFIRTRPFPEAHFAVFPPELVEPCVKAGTSEDGCCAACGAPRLRVVERHKADAPPREHGKLKDATGLSDFAAVAASRRLGQAYQDQLDANPPRTVGWEPTCGCGTDEIEPCVILDPFAGSGTTLLVANRLGRNAVGVELSAEYAAMARRRLASDMPLFASETSA